MLVRLLLIAILIIVSLFCWLAFLNPVDVEFHFFGETFPTDLSILMISSFVLGVILVFMATLVRDLKRAIQGYQQTRTKKKEQSVKEAFNRGMEAFLRGDLAKAKRYFTDTLKKDSSQIEVYFKLS